MNDNNNNKVTNNKIILLFLPSYTYTYRIISVTVPSQVSSTLTRNPTIHEPIAT